MTNANSESLKPLLLPSSLPFGAIAFDQIKTAMFKPALTEAIAKAKADLELVGQAKEPANFANTLLQIETIPEPVNRVAGIFFNLLGTNTDDEMQALAKELSPQLAAFSSDLLLNDAIFQRVKSVWDRREELSLKGEDLRLAEKTYKDFKRNGSMLSPEKKVQLRALDQELARLGPEFSDHILKATNEFKMVLNKKEELDGLPESAIESYSEAATEAGLSGQWVVTLHVPSFLPFMTYSTRRDLREKLWRAYNSRGYSENPNVIQQIVRLRHDRARLLGYDTHAAFVLEERMASTPKVVTDFLERLLVKAKPAAQRDLAQVRSLKKEVTGDDAFQPWDYAYWSEKLKMKLHDLDEELLRPYFKLENVIDGAFEHARRLYGLVFKPVTGIPVHHPDVKTFEVVEEGTGKEVGLFYADFFPRASKRSGAWMTAFREQGFYQGATKTGSVERPHIAIVCNFTKPTATAPSLLTLDEVKTLFHEFGHALHGLLSDCHYVSLSGTNVYWDFVELPSQIMENWVSERESLSLFAKHYQNGNIMPVELTEKIRKSAQFQAGYQAIRQLQFATLDMAWHTADPADPLIKDVSAFEKKATAGTALFAPVEGTNSSVAFSHIFAGGYSAGYYSYKWAEVLDADAFEFFKERGLFDREVARKFRDHVLSRGGTEPPMELYKRFRGREPDPDALLRRDGLI